MAYAAARMAESVLLGLEGEQGIVECTFVESEVHPDFQYFASKVGVRMQLMQASRCSAGGCRRLGVGFIACTGCLWAARLSAC